MASRTERNALVRENLAIVGYLVNEVARKAPHVSRDELASAGALGLVLAADSFDPAQGVPFGAFARTAHPRRDRRRDAVRGLGLPHRPAAHPGVAARCRSR